MNKGMSIFPVCALLCALACQPGWAADASEPFRQGTQAFRAGHYSDALRFFLEAQNRGGTNDQLQYNLGVTYYRLGDYSNARARFEALTLQPKLAPIAHYNLGLIALKTGAPQTARAEFQRTAATTTDPRLRQLAEKHLGTEVSAGKTKSATKPASASSGNVRLSGGYDDNAALAGEASQVPASQRGSALAALLAGGHVTLMGDQHDGLLLSGSAYGIAFPQASAYNFSSLRAGPQLRGRFGPLQTEIGVYASYLTFGGKAFQTLGTLGGSLDYSFSRTQDLLLAYKYDRIHGAGGYSDLTGSRHSLKLSDTWRNGPVKLEAGYRLEINQRQDLSRPATGEFFSVSPTRHRGFVEARWKLSDVLHADLELQYERSRYRDPNLFLRGATLVSQTRVDQRYFGQFQLSYDLTKDWDIAAAYRYLDHPSNIPQHAYRSNRVELKLGYAFR